MAFLLSHIRKSLVLGSAVVLLSACGAHHRGIESQQTKAACNTNAFLKKYHCSLDKVEQAAETYDPDAEYALGYMYYYGIDTQQDITAATLWMKRAAAQGQPQAIQALQLLQKAQYPTAGQVQANANASAVVANTTPVTNSRVQSTFNQANLKSLNGYSIQLAASPNLSHIKQFVLANKLRGKAGFYKTCMHNQAWYILIYGQYSSIREAVQASHQLPSALQAERPWVKSYRTIQAQIAQGKHC